MIGVERMIAGDFVTVALAAPLTAVGFGAVPPHLAEAVGAGPVLRRVSPALLILGPALIACIVVFHAVAWRR